MFRATQHSPHLSLPTPWSRLIPEKLTGFQLVKKFPAFYGTRKYITAFISARRLSLSWDSLIQSLSRHPISWKSILTLSSHLRLGLPSGLFPSVSPLEMLRHEHLPADIAQYARTSESSGLIWHVIYLFVITGRRMTKCYHISYLTVQLSHCLYNFSLFSQVG